MTNLSYGPFISRTQAKKQGLKHYYVGPCKLGHQARRLVSDKRCRVCNSSRSTARNKARSDSDPIFRAKRIQQAMEWRKQNPSSSAVIRKRYEEQPSKKAVKAIRTLIRSSIQGHGQVKTSKTAQLLGCTVQEARDYLQSLFTPGMSWDNHGEWHIDHIRPVASFDDPADPACWNYTNLQPLWAADNIRKSDTWEPVAAWAR